VRNETLGHHHGQKAVHETGGYRQQRPADYRRKMGQRN